MKRRAEVWKSRYRSDWYVSTHYSEIPEGHLPIGDRPVGLYLSKPFPTHAAALAHALAEVGLTENTGKEKDR